MTLLGVVRVLARQGLRVHASTSSGDLAYYSRYLARDRRLPGLAREAVLGEYLSTLRLSEGVLLPCSDELAVLCSRLPEEVTRNFPTYQAAPDALAALADKGQFYELVKSNDVPHPRTLVVDDARDLVAIDGAEWERSFIKPRASQRFQRDFGVKALRPRSAEEFLSAIGAVRDAGHAVLLQEYVPGPPSNHYFVDGFAVDGGEIVSFFGRRRLRMYPGDFGNSTLMVSVAPEEVREPMAQLRKLLAAVAYRGVFSAEFKRDERDGVFRIIELNVRPWWYVEFAASAGVDVVGLAYRAALGMPIDPPRHYQVGRRMIYPSYNLRACRASSGHWGAAWIRTLREMWGADQPVFRWDDPFPLVGRSLAAARRRWRSQG